MEHQSAIWHKPLEISEIGRVLEKERALEGEHLLDGPEDSLGSGHRPGAINRSPEQASRDAKR
jgi:hypothetical protein